ncbi:tetratricopeptide repeat protein [Stieleria sp. TO1_6]|nr:tetratricopeptide repeat protein [Stieleria tagensis]
MMDRFPPLALTALLLVAASGLPAQRVVGQSSNAPEEIADRFLQVLLRRPQPGTALDRVYDYHIQNQSLDSLLESLSKSDASADAGRRQFVRGLLLTKRDRLPAAITALQNAERLLPDNAVVSYELGKLYLASGDQDAARLALQRAIERKPNQQIAADLFLDLGRLHLQSGRTDQAIDVWQKLEARSAGNLTIAEKIAQTLVDEKQFQLALQRYQQLARQAVKDDDKVRYQIQTADIQRRLGNTAAATEQLQTILRRLRPGSWLYTDVRDRLESHYLSESDYDGLAKFYTDLSQRSANDPAILIRLAQVLAGGDRIDDAESTLRDVIRTAPTNIDARLALIDVLKRRQRWADVGRQFETLAELDPDNPDVLLEWSQVVLSDPNVQIEQRRKDAMQIWQRLAESRSEDPVVLSQLAKRYDSIGRSEDAITLYRQSIDAAPDDALYRESLGEYLHQLGRTDAALQTWTEIAAGPRRNRDTLVRLADILQTFQLFDQSLAVWRDAAALDLTFDQRLRYASLLVDHAEHDTALKQLDVAESIAQSAEEAERLMRLRVIAHAAAGTLAQQITKTGTLAETADNQRFLALLHQAANQLPQAATAIDNAARLAPDDTGVLIVVAEIAEKQGKLQDAINALEKLAKKDERLRLNHLQNVARLQQRQGDYQAAIATAQTLVDANPTRTESYRLYARLATYLGRTEDAIRMLRQSTLANPRDNTNRLQLAALLAEQFETADAIEHYWQALEFENVALERIRLVELMVPLYARRGEVQLLLNRVKRFDSDLLSRENNRMLAVSVLERLGDHKQAITLIEQQLAEHPGQLQLLTAMVRNLEKTSQLVRAVTFQQQIADIENSDANQTRLLELQLSAGLITPYDLLVKELQLTKQPQAYVSIIRRATDRSPLEGIEICRMALQKDPDCWGIKLIQAQLMLAVGDPSKISLHTADEDSNSPESTKAHVQAVYQRVGELAAAVGQLGLDPSTQPPSMGSSSAASNPFVYYGTRTIRTVPQQGNVRSSITPPSMGSSSAASNPYVYYGTRTIRTVTRQGNVRSSITPPAVLRTQVSGAQVSGAQLSGTISIDKQLYPMFLSGMVANLKSNQDDQNWQTFGANQLSEVRDFHQAVWLSRALQIIAKQRVAELDSRQLSPRQVIDDLFPLPTLDQTDDVAVLQQILSFHYLEGALLGKQFQAPDDLLWKIAAVDPLGNNERWYSNLMQRAANAKRSDASNRSTPERSSIQIALPNEKLDALVNIYLALQQHNRAAPQTAEDLNDELQLRRCVINEFQLARKELPQSFSQPVADPNDRFLRIVADIQAALWDNDLERAEHLVSRLLVAARGSDGGDLTPSLMSMWLLSPGNETELKFLRRHQAELIDAWIAFRSNSANSTPQHSTSSSAANTSNAGQCQLVISTPGNSKQTHRYFRLPCTLNRQLINGSLIRGLLPLVLLDPQKPGSRSIVSFPAPILENLKQPLSGAPPHEQKLRVLVAAFAAWWGDDPDQCYAELVQLADHSSNDLDLQIESARLAAVTNHLADAVARIKQIATPDVQTRTRVNQARLEIAKYQVTEPPTKTAAPAVLKITRQPSANAQLMQTFQKRGLTALPGGVATSTRQFSRNLVPMNQTQPSQITFSDQSERLQKAKERLQSGDRITAAELAYTVLQQPGFASSDVNQTVYRDAIEILKAANRLDALVDLTERRLNNDPTDDTLHLELAALYLAADKPRLARRCWLEQFQRVNTTSVSSIDDRFQYLSQTGHTAGRLLDSGFPFDAAIICRHTLQQAATKWIPTYPQNESVKRRTDALRGTLLCSLQVIDANDATNYLLAVAEDVLDAQIRTTLDLGGATAADINQHSPKCLFAHAVELAMTTEPGRASVKKLLDRLNALPPEPQSNWSVVAMQLVVSAAITPDSAVKQMDQLTAQRSGDSPSTPQNAPSLTSDTSELVALVYAASSMTRSEHPALRMSAAKLIKSLETDTGSRRLLDAMTAIKLRQAVENN